jgi:hypothetical protein
VSSTIVSTRRRPNPLPAEEKGKRESQERFIERQARRRLIEEAKVTTEVDVDGREWTVCRLADSFAD